MHAVIYSFLRIRRAPAQALYQAHAHRRFMIADVHTHFFLPETLKEPSRRFGNRLPKLLGDERGRLYVSSSGHVLGPLPKSTYDIERRVKEMDKLRIDIQVLSVIPSLCCYWTDAEAFYTLAKMLNDTMASTLERNPDRFAGMATVPLQNVESAVEELERSIKVLGLNGVEILTNINGRDLDSEDLWPFYSKVQKLKIPIFVHPFAVSMAGIERMRDYYLHNLIGNPLETSLAISNIIFGGVLKAFPNLKFIFAHAGGFIPYQRGRIEKGYQVRKETQGKIPTPPSAYIRLLYFDTITHYPPALAYLISTAGSDKILLGSDYPFDMGDPDPVNSINTLSAIPEEDKLKILGRNAAELFAL